MSYPRRVRWAGRFVQSWPGRNGWRRKTDRDLAIEAAVWRLAGERKLARVIWQARRGP